jgi:lipoate---protein ligase
MPIPFRVIDTGVRDGRRQIAFDEALIELHKSGRIPDTIRFMRFPPTALVGRHQAINHEIELEHVRANGIGLVRRITGGGAIYLDPGQVGWEVVLSRRRVPMPSLPDYAQAICEGVAGGLSTAFGIAARFRPRNDIEVDGQKLSGAGGFFDGDTLIYQGTVLIDVDPAAMLACLNVPRARQEKRDLDRAETRITTLKALLGRAPSVEAVHEAVLAGLSAKLDLALESESPTPGEETLARARHDTEIGTDDFVFSIDEPRGEGVYEGSSASPGGTVSAFLRLEGKGGARRIREVLFAGDFFVLPPRLVLDLEACLRGVAVQDATSMVDTFFAAATPTLLSVPPTAFRDATTQAITAGT